MHETRVISQIVHPDYQTVVIKFLYICMCSRDMVVDVCRTRDRSHFMSDGDLIPCLSTAKAVLRIFIWESAGFMERVTAKQEILVLSLFSFTSSMNLR